MPLPRAISTLLLPEVNPDMTTARSFAGSVNAPDFPDGVEWLNTDRPLAMADLRGKVVVLDFWTYC